jgi:hypothetical protein
MEQTMDVRWENQIVEAGKNGRGRSLVAVLVEDYQEAKKSKMRFIEQLGSIKERILNSRARDMRAFHQGLFWARVDKKLDHLTLKPEQRKEIESKISETVPRPNGDWALWSVTCIPRYDP